MLFELQLISSNGYLVLEHRIGYICSYIQCLQFHSIIYVLSALEVKKISLFVCLVRYACEIGTANTDVILLTVCPCIVFWNASLKLGRCWRFLFWLNSRTDTLFVLVIIIIGLFIYSSIKRVLQSVSSHEEGIASAQFQKESLIEAT